MIQGSQNPTPCTPVIIGNNNYIIELGTITRSGDTFTFSVGFKWQIANQTYQNANSVDLTLIGTDPGDKRIDVAILTNTNTIELLSGVASSSIAIRPTIPTNAILLTEWNIDGTSIADNSSPLVGADYLKKSFYNNYAFNGSGANQSIPVNPNGYTDIRLTNPSLISIKGMDLSLITGNQNAEVPFNGKYFILRNLTPNPVIIKHDESTADIPFFINGSLDLTVPIGGIVFIIFDYGGCELVFENWKEDLSTKADLVGGKVPASQLPSYVDDVLEFLNFSSFPSTGESGKLYVALDSNSIYRWSGSTYIVFSTTPALPSNDNKTYGIKNGTWTEITGGDQIITMHHPSWNCQTQNQWRRWQVNASSILADSDNGSLGTGITPDTSIYYACNVLKITNKTQLKGLTLSLRNSSSAHTIQLYVESRNFVAGSPGTETNSQVLINESFTVTDGFTKSDFTINTHTLNANSIIYFSFRRTSATAANNIYGVQLDWKF